MAGTGLCARLETWNGRVGGSSVFWVCRFLKVPAFWVGFSGNQQENHHFGWVPPKKTPFAFFF